MLECFIKKKKFGIEFIISYIKLYRNWLINIIWNLLMNLIGFICRDI